MDDIFVSDKNGVIKLLELKDIKHQPSINEISDYINNSIFDQFYQYMNDEYQVLSKIEYSKDVWFPGWNIKLRKAGKGLCVIYPKVGYFTVLVVVGKHEKAVVENILTNLCTQMQEIYTNTKEGNGQRWLMIDIKINNQLYQDMLKLIRIRRGFKC